MSATKEKTKHIDELHNEHKIWINDLGFYKDELKVFNRRLTEIGGMYTDKNVLAKLEHFQNQFILQNEILDILLHDLKTHENTLALEAKKSPVAIDHRAFPDHTQLREKMDRFTLIFKEVKDDYQGFLSRLM